MKHIALTILSISIILGLSISSCKKYADGPVFSLRTKQARVSGDWKVEKISYNGVDETANYMTAGGGSTMIMIERDKTYTIMSNGATMKGTWSLGGDGDDIYFKGDTATTELSYRILRLKNKELWWKHTELNGDLVETHFVPAK